MITLSQLVQELQEGVYDPNIFKAIFLAGGPGSGKSYVAKRTLGGQGLKVVNSDDAFEKLLKKAGLSLRMPEREKLPRDIVRTRAKELTKTRQTNYIEGRLGLIIDGTGRDYDRISKQAAQLQNLGYDTYMIFVNTSLEVALQRNEKRARRVEDSIVKSSWNAVQQNIGKFSLFFKNGFIVVDNNRADEDVMRVVSKRVRSLLKKPVQNGRAKAWIQNELQTRKR
jgi:dephospho-CoA kinase